jgi:hypothetical protein
LPHSLDAETKEQFDLATAVVGTLPALALGLVIASSENAYDNVDMEIRNSVARVVLLDRFLAPVRQHGKQ